MAAPVPGGAPPTARVPLEWSALGMAWGVMGAVGLAREALFWEADPLGHVLGLALYLGVMVLLLGALALGALRCFPSHLGGSGTAWPLIPALLAGVTAVFAMAQTVSLASSRWLF